MPWTLQKIKTGNNSNAIMVSMAVKFIISIEWIYTSEQFKEQFDKHVAELKNKHSYYQPKDCYRAFIIDPDNLEVWKVKIDGTKEYMMFKIYKP